MRIIKKGEVKKEEWRGLCLYCHCEFMYDRNDIKKIKKLDHSEGEYIVCPTCKKFIDVAGRNNA